MDKNKQLIAIAKACGKNVEAFCFSYWDNLDNLKRESPHYVSKEEAEYWREKESRWGQVSEVRAVESHENLPNYLNDFNAMSEAKKILTDDQQLIFCKTLVRIVAESEGLNYNNGTEDDHLIWLSRATTEQYVEVFLKTIGKWEIGND